MKHPNPISRLRDGTPGRDKALLDLLHLQELGLVPGRAPVRLLESLWRVSQSQVSRRMAAVGELGICRVEPSHGAYVLGEPLKPDQVARRERYEAARRQLQEVFRG